MRVDLFDYELPSELIAQEPAPRRDASRLMLLRGIGSAAPPPPEHHRFAELPHLLRSGDLLVVNDARVLAARLQARRPTGGRVELLLLEPGDADSAMIPGKADGDAGEIWKALARPAKRVRPGESLRIGGEDGVDIRVVASGEDGERYLAFPAGVDVTAFLEEYGSMPLPPYIEPPATEARDAMDRRRYQTVYARRPGAVAAPTAGLHFTPELLERLEATGVGVARLTLHVGAGTFRPITAADVDEHVMDPERYEIPERTAEAVTATRESGGRVVAVGTTCVRALEDAATRAGGGFPATAVRGSADLFIRPGDELQAVDGMITNFHLPRSTPILLVAALAGRRRLLDAYREAVRRRYRFYSYGDAMLLLP